MSNNRLEILFPLGSTGVNVVEDYVENYGAELDRVAPTSSRKTGIRSRGFRSRADP